MDPKDTNFFVKRIICQLTIEKIPTPPLPIKEIKLIDMINIFSEHQIKSNYLFLLEK